MPEPDTILLVDDEAGIRKVLGISLTDAGYNVLMAENGEQGLEVFRRELPPIVLTDIKMPGMDGIDFLKKIKEEQPDTEVIMITGHGDMELAIKSLKYEATDFVTKPINEDILEIALKRAHERISMRREIREYTHRLEELVQEKTEQLIRSERLAAVGQAVESLASAFRDIVDDLDGDITFFNDLPCFVAIHNRELKILATNQLFKDRLGDFVGRGSWEAYRGPAATPNLCPVANTLETGKGMRTKERVASLSGAELPVIVHTAPIRGGGGDVELVLEISADITEVRRVQEELWDTQAKYHQLFEASPCYITVQDRDLKIQAANKLFRRDFGDMQGSFCHQVYRQIDDVCPNCPVLKTFADGETHQTEVVVSNRANGEIHLLVTTAPIWNADDEVVEVIEMAVDITEIRKLQSHLSHLGLLIGSISHSIKGLLTGLDGGMYLVESGFAKENQEQIKEGWQTVQLTVGRIRNMVLDILYYAKERDLKWEKVDVLSFVEDVALTIMPKARNHGIGFVRDFDRSVGEFEVDPGVCRSALINILENAIEACQEDKSKQDHQVVFGVSQDRDHIIFNIRDNGIGMSEETKGRLFELFFSSKGTRGTGLGLFISDKIIRQHGGRIEVESEPGQGSTFKVILPKVPPEEARPESLS
jgi:signal transduction histidine kinase/FixJ family two-component response regulator